MSGELVWYIVARVLVRQDREERKGQGKQAFFLR